MIMLVIAYMGNFDSFIEKQKIKIIFAILRRKIITLLSMKKKIGK
jgi:hypothetical protein